MVWGKRRDTVLHGEVPFNAELPSSALASGGKVTPLYAYAADSVVATLVSAGRSDRCWAYLATSRRRTCARPVGTAIMVADGRGRTTTTERHRPRMGRHRCHTTGIPGATLESARYADNARRTVALTVT
jgi:hypothetical protein